MKKFKLVGPVTCLWDSFVLKDKLIPEISLVKDQALSPYLIIDKNKRIKRSFKRNKPNKLKDK